MLFLFFSLLMNISVFAQPSSAAAERDAILQGSTQAIGGTATILKGQADASKQAETNRKEIEAKTQEAEEKRAKEKSTRAAANNINIAVLTKAPGSGGCALTGTIKNAAYTPKTGEPSVAELNGQCASFQAGMEEADSLKARAKKLDEQAAALGTSSSAWLSTFTGLGQIAVGIGSAYFGMKNAKDQAAWEREQQQKALEEKCEIKCPKMFAQGTAEYRRCVCQNGCGYQYNCLDAPCEEQYSEMTDATLKPLMLAVCKCKKGGFTYEEKSNKCVDQDQNKFALASVNDGPAPSNTDAKPAGKKDLPAAAADKPLSTAVNAPGSGGAKGAVAASDKGDSGSAGAKAAMQPKSYIGGTGGSGFANLSDRDNMGAGGSMLGSKINEMEKVAKPKDIEVAQGMSVFDLVRQVHETGIQANRFMFMETVQNKSKVKAYRSRKS